MRHATPASVRSSSDIGQQSGTQNNTIAIAMSFDYPDPAKAQAVLQSFVTKFLSMDSEDVEDQASLTVRFLQDQANKLQGQISDIEGQITALKARNGAALASERRAAADRHGQLQRADHVAAKREPAADRAEPASGRRVTIALAAAEAQLAAAPGAI